MSKRRRGQPTPEASNADLFEAMGVHAPTKARAPTTALRVDQNARKPLRAHIKETPATDIVPRLLNVRQAAARLGLSKSTLDKMRCVGKGPRFIRSTDRAVRYDPADLDAWISERRRRSTAES